MRNVCGKNLLNDINIITITNIGISGDCRRLPVACTTVYGYIVYINLSKEITSSATADANCGDYKMFCWGPRGLGRPRFCHVNRSPGALQWLRFGDIDGFRAVAYRKSSIVSVM